MGGWSCTLRQSQGAKEAKEAKLLMGIPGAMNGMTSKGPKVHDFIKIPYLLTYFDHSNVLYAYIL